MSCKRSSFDETSSKQEIHILIIITIKKTICEKKITKVITINEHFNKPNEKK